MLQTVAQIMYQIKDQKVKSKKRLISYRAYQYHNEEIICIPLILNTFIQFYIY